MRTVVLIRRADARHRSAFTLVELLVVIGIIALLIAILMPTLSRARSAALVVKCLAVERALGQAAQLHANEHKGYLPIAGVQARQAMGVECTPEGLRDGNRVRYTYFLDSGSGTFRPVPLTLALARYMAPDVRLGDMPEVESQSKSDAILQFFLCPAQDTETIKAAPTITDTGDWNYKLPVKMGYLFNGEILGWRSHTWALEQSPAGKLTAIRRPAEVFLFADGNCTPNMEVGMEVLAVEQDWTLYDYWLRYGASDYWDSTTTPQLDARRHRARVNVLFVDWHAETLVIPPGRTRNLKPPSDLDVAGITKGVYP